MRSTRTLLALPAMVAGLAYLATLRYQFVWDDTIFLVDLPTYRVPDGWIDTLLRPFALSPNYFRPLALLTFMADLRLWGTTPLPFHLANLALHMVNTLLVTVLAWRLRCHRPGGRPWAAVLGGLAYGLHPALVESVAFVSSRFDLLVTTCVLLALVGDLRLRHRSLARAALVGAAFLAAAMAKEMAMAFLALLPLWIVAVACEEPGATVAKPRRAELNRHIPVLAAVSLAASIYLVARRISLGYLILPGAGHPVPVGDALPHLVLVGRSVAEYVRLVVWPFGGLSPIHYSPLPLNASAASNWLGPLGAAVALGAVLMLVRRRRRPGLLALAAVLALLPVVNVVPLELGGGAFVAERYLTLPLAMVALAVASLPEMSSSKASFAVAVWVAAALATLLATVPHWRSDQALWTWAAARAPASALARTNLSKAAIDAGDFDLALAAADQALSREPGSANAWNDRGLALFQLGRYAEAEAAFAAATDLDPSAALYWNNLAGAMREQGRLVEAQRILLDRVLGSETPLPVGDLNLGMIYLRAERPDLAEPYLLEAQALLPAPEAVHATELLQAARQPDAWLRLADRLADGGESGPALDALARAGTLGASEADVLIGRSRVLIELRDWAAASGALDAALRAAPQDARVYNNLGVLAREQGDVERARHWFERASALAPVWQLPHANLDGLESGTS